MRLECVAACWARNACAVLCAEWAHTPLRCPCSSAAICSLLLQFAYPCRNLLMLLPSAHVAATCPFCCSGWLDFLEEVRQLVGQVVLLTCPTDRIRRANQQEGRKVVAERNRLLREMIPAQQGGGAIAAAAGSGAIERQLQTGDGSSSSSSGNGGRVAGSLGSSHGTTGKGGSTKQPSGGARRGSSKGCSSKASGSSRESGSSRGQRAAQPAGPPVMLVDIDGLTQGLPPGLAVAPLD